jgi:hypothetical protein
VACQDKFFLLLLWFLDSSGNILHAATKRLSTTHAAVVGEAQVALLATHFAFSLGIYTTTNNNNNN